MSTEELTRNNNELKSQSEFQKQNTRSHITVLAYVYTREYMNTEHSYNIWYIYKPIKHKYALVVLILNATVVVYNSPYCSAFGASDWFPHPADAIGRDVLARVNLCFQIVRMSRLSSFLFRQIDILFTRSYYISLALGYCPLCPRNLKCFCLWRFTSFLLTGGAHFLWLSCLCFPRTIYCIRRI